LLHSFYYFYLTVRSCPGERLERAEKHPKKNKNSQVKDSVGVAEAAASSEKNLLEAIGKEWIQNNQEPVSWFKWGAD
jgi:precorrin-6x reductase